jgi:hypothetical protein
MPAADWTATSSVVLAVLAIITAWYARKAFRAQSREVRDLEKEQRRQSAEREWAQARRVYVTRDLKPADIPAEPTFWAPGAVQPTFLATVHNRGDRPVYDARVHWVDSGKLSQAGSDNQLGTIGPDDSRAAQQTVPGTVSPDDFTPVAYFRDAAGLRWTVLPDGHLAPVDKELAPGAPQIAIRAVEEAQRNPAGKQRISSPERRKRP